MESARSLTQPLHEPPELTCHWWYSALPLFWNCSSRPSQLLIWTMVAAVTASTWVNPRASVRSIDEQGATAEMVSAISGAASRRRSWTFVPPQWVCG